MGLLPCFPDVVSSTLHRRAGLLGLSQKATKQRTFKLQQACCVCEFIWVNSIKKSMVSVISTQNGFVNLGVGTMGGF